MSAGHSLRRGNYTFAYFDTPVRNASARKEGLVPGPFAVIFTVAITATFSFVAMDQAAASWLRETLLSLWLLLNA